MRDPKQHQKYLTELFNMYKNKEIKPQITASFPLKDAAKALASAVSYAELAKNSSAAFTPPLV